MLKEFKEFAMKGNVLDLAIAVIIGAAFGAVVQSLVADILMPIIAAITGGIDFSNLFVGLAKTVKSANLADAKKEGAVLAYGSFLTLVVNFIIIAFVMFLLVKASNAAKKPKAEAPAAPPPPSDEVKLLTEIRDALRKN